MQSPLHPKKYRQEAKAKVKMTQVCIELHYIFDPKEVHGDDFPGETFRVLKEKEVKQFGEYRTSRLVLEAWDNLK